MAGDNGTGNGNRSAATLAKVAKLLTVAKEEHEKLGAVLAECEALLAGKPGIGEQIKTVTAAFDRAWCARYAPGQTGRYVWAWVKDTPQIKRLLKTLTAEEIGERAVAYVRDGDEFYVRARHPFGLFVSSINRHAPRGVDQEDLELDPNERRAVACIHVPACRSEAEHTARRNRELRTLEQ